MDANGRSAADTGRSIGRAERYICGLLIPHLTGSLLGKKQREPSATIKASKTAKPLQYGNFQRMVSNKKTSKPAASDLLLKRLRALRKADVKALLTEGLLVSDDDLQGLKKEGLVLRCSKDLRSAAGSSTRNLFRGDHEFPYKQLLIDVADKLTEGATWLSWTKYTLGDSHPEAEIEDAILQMFEERARKWWVALTDRQKAKVTEGLQNLLKGQAVGDIKFDGGPKSFVMQQLIENVIQQGIIFGLSKVSIPGLTGALGASVVGQVGWLVLLNTVGWMGGLKIAVFGIGGYGALGGAVGTLGSTVIGGALGIPTLFIFVDGPAYRKTIPTVLMLLARTRADSLQTR